MDNIERMLIISPELLRNVVLIITIIKITSMILTLLVVILIKLDFHIILILFSS